MDPGRRLGVEQVVLADLADDLLVARVAELRGVPRQSAVVVAVEEVEVLRRSQVDVRVLEQDLVQPGRAGLVGTDVQEVGQPAHDRPRPRRRARREHPARLDAGAGDREGEPGVRCGGVAAQRAAGDPRAAAPLTGRGPRVGDLAEDPGVAAAAVPEVGVLVEQVLQRGGGVEPAVPEPGRDVLADVGQDLLDRTDRADPARAQQPVVVLAVAVRQLLVVQPGHVEGRAPHHQGRAVQLLDPVLAAAARG